MPMDCFAWLVRDADRTIAVDPGISAAPGLDGIAVRLDVEPQS